MKAKIKAGKLPKGRKDSQQKARAGQAITKETKGGGAHGGASGTGQSRPTEMEVKYVLRKEVRPDPNQPRKTFDGGKLKELAESIEAVGIRQPIQVEWVSPIRILEPDLVSTEWQAIDDRGPFVIKKGTEEQVRKAVADRDGGFYRIVDGERRWRAAELAQVERIPIMLVDTSSPDWEKKKLAIQVVLNQQHENLTALDEAAAFQREIDSGKHTAESLYATLGISRGKLFQRLALNRVDERVRKALLDGAISASVAGLMSVVPKGAIEDALADLAGDEYTPPQSFRDAQDLIEREYAKQLKDASFDLKDAEVLPERWGYTDEEGQVVADFTGRPEGVSLTPALRAHTGSRTEDDGAGHKKTIHVVSSGELGSTGGKVIADGLSKPVAQLLAEHINRGNAGTLRRLQGGACTDCPYRSGNLEGSGLKNPNVCTLPRCFDAKQKAARAAIVEAAEEKGKTVLPANKTGNLFSTYGGATELHWNAPYVKPGDKVPGDKKGRTYKELVGEAVDTVHALNGNGTLVALMEKSKAAKALAAAGIKADAGNSHSNYEAERKKTAEKVKRLQAAAKPAVAELLSAVRKAPADKKFLQMVAAQVCNDYEFLKNRNWSGGTAWRKKLEALDEEELRVVIVEAIATGEVDTWSGQWKEDFKQVCETYGVDLEKHVDAAKGAEKKEEKSGGGGNSKKGLKGKR